jgi:class 3 adenylate cyclase
MAKFSVDRFPPGFFDLPTGAGETLPLDTIAEWTRSPQTREVARAILAPHALRGIVVSSDSAGLTRLTRERSLIDILAMLTHPKELIHGHGCAIGGRSVGVWAADNTLMFYDHSIAANRVLAMLRTTMERMAIDCELGIGMAAHSGEFFELGGGVHGPDAERVELIAESHTEPGELVITGSVVRLLPADHGFALVPRDDLRAEFGDVARVAAGLTLDGLDVSNINYPAPFSSDFTSGLARFARTQRDSAVPQKAYEDLAVVFILRESEDTDVPEVAVLNDLALTAAMKRIGGELLVHSGGDEVKTSGLIGIYTFPDCRNAIAFARRFRDALAEQRIQCAIGIDSGPVLVFDLGGGSFEIAGLAVNVASKLAEDVGAFGKIQISEQVAKKAEAKRERPTLAFNMSGVELRAYDL